MGHHVLLNLYDCAEVDRLKDLEAFQVYVLELLRTSNAEVVSTSSFKFPGEDSGYTLLSLLSTSHFSIHTWPEFGSAAVDVFTCGNVKTGRIVKKLREYFQSSTVVVKDVLR